MLAIQVVFKPTLDIGLLRTRGKLGAHFALIHCLFEYDTDNEDGLWSGFLINPVNATFLITYEQRCVFYVDLFSLLFGHIDDQFDPRTEWYDKETEYKTPYRIMHGRYARTRSLFFELTRFLPFLTKKGAVIEYTQPEFDNLYYLYTTDVDHIERRVEEFVHELQKSGEPNELPVYNESL